MNVIFDIGEVLIQWNVKAAFPDVEDVATFLDESDFFAWNTFQDAGRSQEEAAAAARASHPEHAENLIKYFDRFGASIQNKVPGTWEIMEELRAKGHRIFGLTNWAAETYPIAQKVHPELAAAFEDVVVSGREKLLKPEPEIYRCLLDRNGLDPSECLFIDDSPKNVGGAKAVGIDAVQFTDAGALHTDLSRRGLL